ncbi:zf-HC2 domain-containing protein [uncultured Leifsonia sp.]|uniref:anti-sigma factor family protein n=1 Tax=uncultured Leifsonia sp. TaxID=340359 RepID=UPI0028D86B47|nr:zf-HC2 domain-containing protein [uncultured Leifsonia sp.]
MTHEEFATWDAAYVLGALSPAERKAYEEHLRGCERCSDAVAELAGMPGLLGRVPREQAFALLEAEAPADSGVGAEVLPSLLHTARRRRIRSRWITAAVAAGVAAVLVGVLAFVLPTALSSTGSPVTSVAMQQVEPSAVTADLRLTAEPWGTRIESRCSYASVGSSEQGRSWTYAMVVTDRAGRQTQISTWSAQEGTTAVPTATTSIPIADIAAIDIRAAGNGTVLLRSTFR